MTAQKCTTIEAFTQAVAKDASKWGSVFPWFRGESECFDTPLLPMVFRTPKREYHDEAESLDEYEYDENNLLQTFRRRAHLMGLPIVPQRDETDKWLFLARHVGLPTRLLDWSEGALVGLFFALLEKDPVVWMLNPHELNLMVGAGGGPNEFPITWDPKVNGPAFHNVQAAWVKGEGEVRGAVAIQPHIVHPRMYAQHSNFTVHGSCPQPFGELIEAGWLKKYRIEISDRSEALRKLKILGVAESKIMPDAEALAAELRRYLVRPTVTAHEDEPGQ